MPSLPGQPMFTEQFLCCRCRAHQLVFHSCSSFELGGRWLGGQLCTLRTTLLREVETGLQRSRLHTKDPSTG